MNNVAMILSRNPRLGNATLTIGPGDHEPSGMRIFYCLQCGSGVATSAFISGPDRCDFCKATWFPWPAMNRKKQKRPWDGRRSMWSICPEWQYD